MNMRRTVNLVLSMLLVLLLLGAIVFYLALSKQVMSRAEAQLETMLMLRESALRSHFESLRSEIILWSGHVSVVELLENLDRAYRLQHGPAGEQVRRIFIEDNPYADWERERYVNSAGTSPYELLHAEVHPRARKFARHHEYYDVFLVNAAGDVVYTVTKEDDFGTNLLNGPYAGSGLGIVLQRSLETDSPDDAEFHVFTSYAASAGEPAAFIASPVHHEGERLGVFVVQIPVRQINAIMQFSAALGDTGETYLVGEDGFMHSDSRFFEESSVLRIRVDTDSVERALRGETGVQQVLDYRRVPVLSAFRQFQFEGSRWAMLAEQDMTEVRAPLRRAMKLLLGGYLACLFVALLLRAFLLRIVLPHKSLALFGLGLLFDEEALER